MSLDIYQKCTRCRGMKVIMGMGCMQQQCPECNGLGQVKVEALSESSQVIDAISITNEKVIATKKPIEVVDAPRKQRGRPKAK